MELEDMSLPELAQLQEAHRKQMSENRETVKKRKARTHKMIVIGATLNSLIPSLEGMSDEEIRQTVTALFWKL